MCRRRVLSLAIFAILSPLFAQNLPPAPSQDQAQDRSFYLGQEITDPEALSGIWEASNGRDGAVGIYLQLGTTIPSEATTLDGTTQSWEHLNVSLYERRGAAMALGEANSFGDSSRGGSARYDNGRLTLHYPQFDLDLQRLPGDRWSGRFHRMDFDAHVVLTRPHVASGTSPAAIVGTWREMGSPIYSCLHVAETAPGSFTGWSDSLQTLGAMKCSPSVQKPERAFQSYGALVKVRSLDEGGFSIELNAYNGICCPHTFTGTPDHGMMQAVWGSGMNQSPHKNMWEKMPGNTCIASNQP